jgi:hypothetical protein
MTEIPVISAISAFGLEGVKRNRIVKKWRYLKKRNDWLSYSIRQ